MIRQQTKRELIADSLQDLMAGGKSFQSISISDITFNCGISRRLFYNYYRDKYDVVGKLFLSSLHPMILEKYEDLYSSFLDIFENYNTEKTFWKKIFRDDMCYEYIQNLLLDHSCVFFGISAENKHTDTYIRALIKYHISGMFRLLKEWLLSNSGFSCSDLATITVNTMPNEIQSLYKNITAQSYFALSA